MDHEAGGGIFLTEAGGHDAHHALMPVLAGEDQGVALLRPQLFNLGHGIGADGLFHRLPFPVQVAQLPGQVLRFSGIGLLQEVGGQVGSPHATGGVDPGGEDEADLDGGDGLAQQARFLQKGVDAHKVRVGQGGQAAGDDGAVFSLHPHNVGHGADGGQGAVPGEEGVFPVRPAQGQHQLQRHAYTGQVFEGIGVVGPVGVHHRHGPRQFLFTFVVVRYHGVHADGGGEVHLLIAGDAAVHGDHQGGALVPQTLDGVLGKAVAVLDPPGDVPQAADTAAFQVIQQQHRGGDTVHIVVAEHGDDLIIGHGLLNPGHSLVHIPHQHGGYGQGAFTLQRLGSGLGSGDAPGGQHGGQQAGVARFLQERRVLLRRCSNVPFLIFHRTRLLFRKSVCPVWEQTIIHINKHIVYQINGRT